ncbi:LLM class flavin-dependent oxidoreductase [Actinoplanes sp. NBRC 103695]|uniref:LLM class flavin-dependent oxidoreductase n=1 Tax=Actinoplanes sp. NBRC 103695 TaxID=3032202 RepID=UPI00249FA734|nr:LLM class flavin-dependent oxidoreductase [Actinoplanes sp. NBRC 103695]GLY93073.1 putative FMNH2-utilizing oxygenase [Actinoplanes sp. NBRC 103695]
MTFSLGVLLDARSFDADEWVRLATLADEARLDYVTIEDTFGSDPARPEASLVAARLAPVTRHVGLVPVLTTTHTEPFHLSTALATVDWVSRGRGGWQVRVSGRPEEAKLLGRRSSLPAEELFAEAADVVEVVRRLWDSWQDDAIIADVATGRFIDRDRLHYIDFEGKYFSVRGPSIVPRPPQGQLPVFALAHTAEVHEFATRVADVVIVTPAPGALELPGVADVVFSPGAAIESDAHVHTGSVGELADLLAGWHTLGATGARVRAGDHLEAVTGELVPLLRERGLFEPRGGTLRERLGLPTATNRYVQEARVA